jgi:MFS family permease
MVEPQQGRRQRRSRRATLLLAFAALAMERADAALLPAVYREIGVALQASPTALGSIALSRSVVQTACYPLAAYLAARHDRLTVIALGAFIWAAATFLIGFSTTFPQVRRPAARQLPCRFPRSRQSSSDVLATMQMAATAALNGVGLALQIPAIHAFVAESVDGASRGVAFGWLTVAGKAGTVAGTSLGLLMASTSFLGLPGWRVAFLLLGVLGGVVGLSIRAFAAGEAAARGRAVTPASVKPVRQELQDFAREAKAVMRVPSFQVIIAQGLTGSFPWSALLFTPMWLELVGFSHGETAALMTLFKIATSVGALFGGKMGDALARRFRNSGRIVLSQISSGSAIPLAGVLLLGLPNDPSTTERHGAALFILGIMASWNGSATNSPILAEIVPPRAMTTVFALDQTFEAVLASFAPPVVGMLAERLYGYKLARSVTDAAGGGVDEHAAVDVEMERHNATSLARAIYTSVAVPMALCCSIYSFLYCTYPRDREAARAEAARDREGHGGEESDSEDEGDGERKLLPQ